MAEDRKGDGGAAVEAVFCGRRGFTESDFFTFRAFRKSGNFSLRRSAV